MARDRFLKIKTFDHKNTEERGISPLSSVFYIGLFSFLRGT
ncbi:hypothetical protein HMPREF1246_1091 [Acidaminococcus sp. BV3L6]|nr:hypothetical protein HMPREF1246_1091 [Acidaminococcus sp. BV3L6]